MAATVTVGARGDSIRPSADDAARAGAAAQHGGAAWRPVGSVWSTVAGDRRAAQCLAVHRSVWCVSRVVVPGDLFFLSPLSLERYVRPDVCRGCTALAPSSYAVRRPAPSTCSPVNSCACIRDTGAGRAGPPSGSRDRKDATKDTLDTSG